MTDWPPTRCRVLVPQTALVGQFPALLQSVTLDRSSLATLRARLLDEHRQRSGEELDQRGALNAEYERVVTQIADVFSQRKDAEALGVLAEVDGRLAELRRRRDELQGKLNRCHDQGDAWIEQVVRSFRLIELLREAIFCGSARPREMVLRGLASNYSVNGKTLIWEPRSPFRQVAQNRDRPLWCTGGDDVRTEVAQTADLLQRACEAVNLEKILRMSGKTGPDAA